MYPDPVPYQTDFISDSLGGRTLKRDIENTVPGMLYLQIYNPQRCVGQFWRSSPFLHSNFKKQMYTSVYQAQITTTSDSRNFKGIVSQETCTGIN
jgi:hypothetical protein